MIIWKNVNKVKPGEKLGEDVYDPSGFIILLKKGSILKEGDIVLLKSRGVNSLPIYEEEIFISSEVEPTIDYENYRALSEELENALNEIKNGQMNISAMVEQSENILNEVLKKIDEKILNLLNNDSKPLIRHCINVAVISSIIGINLGFDRELLTKLVISSFLHDLSHDKPIRDVINYYDTHPIKSAALIKNYFETNNDILLGVLHHHERYDGKGFPRGLKESSIPIFSRIIAVADAYDTLISKDFPGDALTPYEALKFIIINSGKYFDPQIVSKFVHYVGIYPTGTIVELSDGRKGVVLKVSNGVFPIVKVENREIDIKKEKISIKRILKE
ncbi:HD domain protein [Thermosipho africanus Ob7]|uniref:HD-GYP domain-containing protein n=1 Tax=Thermosipho africanus TaxID=2421 RepID=UPI000E0B60BF|nr:HD domain-containing phosphohydrolase [Thermosipho africanus]RDI91981.1 HD domain protein [Thermosipho africanus Ob7]